MGNPDMLSSDTLPSETGLGAGTVAGLNHAAIRYAIHLNRLQRPAHLVSQAVYDFNRLPLASLRCSLPDYAGSAALADDVQRELAGQGCHLDARYRRSANAETKWLYWSLPGGEALDRRLRHKLYVSPANRTLRQALVLVLRLCDAMGVVSFKLGLDAHGVLRSDKLVIYFTDQPSREAFARELLARAGDLEAHGVPLTRGIGTSGLLSTAEDPLMGELSWRQLISAELVDILLAAGEPARCEPAEAVVGAVCAELGRRGLMQALTTER